MRVTVIGNGADTSEVCSRGHAVAVKGGCGYAVAAHEEEDERDMKTARNDAETKAQMIMKRVGDNGIVSKRDLWEVIQRWKCHRDTGRKKVHPEGQDHVDSDTVGLVWTLDGRWCLTDTVKRYPAFVRVLNKFLASVIDKDKDSEV